MIVTGTTRYRSQVSVLTVLKNKTSLYDQQCVLDKDFKHKIILPKWPYSNNNIQNSQHATKLENLKSPTKQR